MSIYLDASLLVSLYCLDTNSPTASQTLRRVPSSEVLVLSTFAELEVVNALQSRRFRKQMSDAETRRTLEAFDEDLMSGRFRVHSLPEPALQRAIELSLKTTGLLGTRTSDLLHIAVALELGADSFYSFDKQQRKLAQRMKLKLNIY